MSYEIVKGIKIENGKVFIKSDSNNVYPKDFSYSEFSYFTKLLNEKGIKETEIALLREFEEGNLQSSCNLKYTRALKVLHYLFKDEYNKFNWRTERENEKRDLRESQEFKDLLWRALNTKLPKEKYIIKKFDNYVRKETSRHIFYGLKESAKIYDFKEIAERTAKHINGEVVLLTA